jgi:hypothetical protein
MADVRETCLVKEDLQKSGGGCYLRRLDSILHNLKTERDEFRGKEEADYSGSIVGSCERFNRIVVLKEGVDNAETTKTDFFA